MSIKLTLRDDCGNSPKNEFAQALTVALVTADAGFVAQSVTDDVCWTIVGIAPIRGKDAVTATFRNPNREPVSEVTIEQVLSHGKAGAVNGTFVLNEDRGGGKFRSKSYSFCYVYEFANAKGTSVAKVTTYIVQT